MNRTVILYFFLITLLVSCKAQPTSSKYTTKSEKAIKAYEKATKYYDMYDNESAITYLQEAIKIDEEFIEAYMLLGDIYSDTRDFETAVINYKKAIAIDSGFFSNNFYNAGMNEYRCGLYAEAKKDLQSFLNFKSANIVTKKRAEYLVKLCDFGINALNNPVPFKPVNIGANVNTASNEYYPQITIDNSTLLFTRLIKDSSYVPFMQEDFYISEKDTTGWGNVLNIGPPVNTKMNEGAPAFSVDGTLIIFTACESNFSYGAGRTGYGSCDLFYTKKTDNAWEVPKNIGKPVNSEAWETQPSLSSDGKTLYFIRGVKGGKGNSDIYMSERKDDDTWSEPVKLSEDINTSSHEESPFIHPDNKSLYFSSDGHLGMGGFDLYVSKKDSTGAWGKPENLGYPINTSGDETCLFIDAKGDLAYFSSNRDGGYGALDIYSFELYDKIKPSPVTYMKGSVFSSVTKEKLKAKIELIDLKTEKNVIESYSDSVKGEFLVCLINENEYALNVSKDGYLFYSENFNLTGEHSKLDPYLKDIPLQPIKKGEIVILKNIFFDTDKYDLRPESKVELEKLLNLLNKNPKMKIEISGHTDNVGDDNYNQTLSENRSKAVYDYLISHNIAKERLSYKGYGESVPINTNDTDEGRANNRRTEFKVMDISGI